MVTTERYYQKISERLNEAKSISDQVYYMAKEITMDLDNLFRTAPKENVPIPGTVIRTGKFLYSYMGISFNVVWRFYNFKDETFVIQGVRRKAKAYLKEKELHVDYYSIGWRIDRGLLMDMVQHEICHFFEYQKQPNPNYKNTDKYKQATQIMQNGNREEPAYSVARIIYIGYKFEQRAFVNGAYGHLMASDDYDNEFENAIKETPLYNWLTNIDKSILTLQKYQGTKDLEDVLKPYHYSYATVLKIAVHTRENLIWMMGRTISKAMQDYPEKHLVMETFTGDDLEEKKSEWLMKTMKKYFCRT